MLSFRYVIQSIQVFGQTIKQITSITVVVLFRCSRHSFRPQSDSIGWNNFFRVSILCLIRNPPLLLLVLNHKHKSSMWIGTQLYSNLISILMFSHFLSSFSPQVGTVLEKLLKENNTDIYSVKVIKIKRVSP